MCNKLPTEMMASFDETIEALRALRRELTIASVQAWQFRHLVATIRINFARNLEGFACKAGIEELLKMIDEMESPGNLPRPE